MKSNKLIIGIDEAGRGPLAGPVVVAAVHLLNDEIEDLTDSKRLSESKRKKLAQIITKHSIWAVFSVSPRIIDEKNILRATLWGMKKVSERVLQKLSEIFPGQLSTILIDGNRTFNSNVEVKAMVKGDLLNPHISAASILAKVHRDNIMKRLDKIYPHYGFARHKGYPTREHYEAIKRYGISPIHRRSFKLKKTNQPPLFKFD